jgi:hypothetical protein
MCSWCRTSAFLLLEHGTHTPEPVATPRLEIVKMPVT